MVEPDPNRRHLRVEWPNVVQLRRTGGNRPVEVRTKPEGPDEGHEVPAHISERINVEPTAGLTARFQGEPPVTAKRFSYLAASTVVKRIELETEEQARGGDDDAPVIQLARLFSQTVNASEEYRQKGYLTGPENQDRWPSDEMAVLSASEWLHRNIQVIKPDRSGVQMEAEGSAIAPWSHTGLLRLYDIGNNPERVYGPTKKSEITYADCDSSWEVARTAPGRDVGDNPVGQEQGTELVHPLRGGQTAEEVLSRLGGSGVHPRGAGAQHRHRDEGAGAGIRPNQEKVGPGILGAGGQPAPGIRHPSG